MSLQPALEFDTPRSRIALDGRWEFAYDPAQVGEQEGWFRPGLRLPEQITLPGCAQAQRFATASPVIAEYDGLPELSSQVLLRYPSRDVNWYARSMEIPSSWQGQAVWLHLGGVKPAADVWLNGAHIGRTESSRCPVRGELTPHVLWGEQNRLVVRIDWPEPGFFGLYDILSAWSGLHRPAWLEAVPAISLADIHVVPSIDPREARVYLSIRRTDGPDSISINCIAVDDRKEGHFAVTQSAILHGASTEVCLTLPMPGAPLWHPDDPRLHTLTVRLCAGETILDEGCLRFGLREIRVDGFHVLLNGQPVFLRGGCDDQYYPETVCPPAEKEFYLQRLRLARAYGFNYTKSCVEPFPREFLDAADEVGLLVCEEMPFLARNDLAAYPDGLPPARQAFMRRELENIIRADRNHPSVVHYSISSELNQDWLNNPHHFRLFSQELPAVARRINPAALVTDATGVSGGGAQLGRQAIPLATALGARDTDTDSSWLYWAMDCRPLAGPIPGLKAVTTPFIFHEFAWITELTDPGMLDRYAVLPVKPLHVPEMLAATEANGQGALLPRMVAGSRQLKMALRKNAFELARTAPQAAGYYHWLLHDFPFCAEGVFNEFWEAPADLPAEAFRAYNDDTVLCLEHGDRWAFAWGQPWSLALIVSHFGAATLASPVIAWTLRAGQRTLARGRQSCAALAPGALVTLPPLPLPAFPSRAPATLELEAVLCEGNRQITRNSWRLWAFPQQAIPASEVLITEQLDAGTLERLAHGGRVLFLSPGDMPASGDLPRDPGDPLYRSVPFNYGTEGNMGTLIRPHPALGAFPHDGWCDFAWAPLLDDARPFALDPFLPCRVDPIIRSVGHMRTMRNKAYLFEVAIGRGRLLACAMHLTRARQAGDPAAHYLYGALLRYLTRTRLEPAPAITLSALRGIVMPDSSVDAIGNAL